MITRDVKSSLKYANTNHFALYVQDKEDKNDSDMSLIDDLPIKEDEDEVSDILP